jgi:hypothetical protein
LPVFRRDGQNILFIHVPKTGGTSVERMFEAGGFEMLYRDGRTGAGSVNSLRTVSPQHMHASLLERTFRLDQFDRIFMLTREPVARFRSEYGMRNSKGLVRDAEAVDAWADKAFKRYRKDPSCFDNHLRPQSEFYVPGAEVYRLEDGLENVMADLDSKVGGGLPSETLRALDRQKTAGVATHEIEVSEQLQRRLLVTYHDDFARFGYALPKV